MKNIRSRNINFEKKQRENNKILTYIIKILKNMKIKSYLFF